MLLNENPFYVLGASTRDTRHRIVECAEEKSLHIDQAISSRCSTDLINPRQRLLAEIAWLPGVSPTRAFSVAHAALSGGHVDPLPAPLAHANVLVTMLAQRADLTESRLGTALLEIAKVWERIDPEQVRVLVNEDRAIAGVVPVDERRDIERALESRTTAIRTALCNVVRRAPERVRVEALTEALERGTQCGSVAGPALLHEIIDALAVDLHAMLGRERAIVDAAVQQVRTAAATPNKRSLDSAITDLEGAVQHWDRFAQALQLSAQSRGRDHQPSKEVAVAVRALAVDLHNDHDHTEAAQRVTRLLRTSFSELTQLTEQIEGDLETLDDLLKARDAAKERRAEWERDIAYEGQIGLVFKDTLRVSAAGIQFNKQCIPLEKVTRLRWGGTKHSINGIPTGTTYNVVVASEHETIAVEMRNEGVYSAFIEKVWRAVGIRLMTQMLATLRAKGVLNIGGTVVDDEGLILTKWRLFGKNYVQRFTWNQLRITNEPGCFVITGREDQGFRSALSYQEVDNVHVLEMAIRFLWKKGGHRLSSILS